MIGPCALCGSESATEVFRSLRLRSAQPTGRHTESLFGKAGVLVRCDTCGLIRQADPLDAPYDEMEDSEYAAEEQGIRITFRGVLDRIESFRRPPGRLLDIGCGPGFLLDEARSRGWEVTGIEPSAWGAEQAHARGIPVVRGTLESADVPEASFDAMVAADVIEHVPDPVAFMKRAHGLLVPGGVVFIATPNVASPVARLLRRWWWSVIPNHLWYFSPQTIDAALRSGGLKRLWMGTHPKTFSMGYYAGRLGGYNNAISTVARTLVRLVGSDRLVTPDFRDRLAVVGAREASA